MESPCSPPAPLSPPPPVACKEHNGYTAPELNDALYLHFSGFRKIENLEPYTALKALWLDSNGITEIAGVAHLAELRCLFLQQNALTRIGPGLAGLTALQTLNLSGNALTRLDGLAALPALLTLNVSKNSLTCAADLAHLAECRTLASLDVSSNELDADEGGSVIAALAAVPALVNLALKGNPVCRNTRHYRKAVVVALPRLTYLDERPVFAPERAATEAWARGGADAERAARAAHEAAQRDAQTASVERFAAWSDGVRAKRAEALRALNAERAVAGEAPLTELPVKPSVSYTTASTRFVTEATLLKRLGERAEKAYAKGGSGVLFEDTDDAAAGGAALTAAAQDGGEGEGAGAGEGAGEGESEGAGSGGGGAQRAGTEREEEAAEAEIAEDVARRERELREAERRARAATDAAVAASLHAGVAPPLPPVSKAVADSLRIFAERAALAAPPDDGGGSDEGEEEEAGGGGGGGSSDDADRGATRFALSAARRAIKRDEWAAAGASFFGRAARGGGDAGADGAAPAPLAPPPPAAAPAAAPADALAAAPADAPADAPAAAPQWFPALDAALMKLTAQAAFDFGKVARGLHNAGEMRARAGGGGGARGPG